MKNTHCCQCGAIRKPTQQPVESFGDNDVIVMERHRQITPVSCNEISPQLIANFGVWRNGGTDFGRTHICDACIVVGLKNIKARVDAAIEQLSAS